MTHGSRPCRPRPGSLGLAAPAGRAALLSGELDDVAFAVDAALPIALHHPARDEAGRLDTYEVTAALVEIYQGDTAADVSARIIGPPAG